MDSYSVKAILSASDRGYTNKMKSAISLLDEFENENKRASASMKDIAKAGKRKHQHRRPERRSGTQ